MKKNLRNLYLCFKNNRIAKKKIKISLYRKDFVPLRCNSR